MKAIVFSVGRPVAAAPSPVPAAPRDPAVHVSPTLRPPGRTAIPRADWTRKVRPTQVSVTLQKLPSGLGLIGPESRFALCRAVASGSDRRVSHCTIPARYGNTCANSRQYAALQHRLHAAAAACDVSARFNSRARKKSPSAPRNPLRIPEPSNSLEICNVSDSGRNKMRYKTMTAALAASVSLSIRRRGFGRRSRSDPLVDIGRRSLPRSPSSPRLSTRPATSGSTAPSPAAGDTARPVMISRITGGDPMGATQFNPAARREELVAAGLMHDLTELATKEDWKDDRPPDEPARRLHDGRQGLLRAGQHPFVAVAVAVQQGVRGCRRAGADELGRGRRGGARALEKAARSRSPSAASPGRRPAPSTC